MRLHCAAIFCASTLACAPASAQHNPNSLDPAPASGAPTRSAEPRAAPPAERRLELLEIGSVEASASASAPASAPPRGGTLELLPMPATGGMQLPPSPLSAAEPAGITNIEIIAMVDAEFSEPTIRAAIGANATRFDVSPAALLALKRAAVPESVIEAMIAAEAPGTQATMAVEAESATVEATAGSAPPPAAAAAPPATAVTGLPMGTPAATAATAAAAAPLAASAGAPSAAASAALPATAPAAALDAPAFAERPAERAPQAWVADGAETMMLPPAIAQVAVTDGKGAGGTALKTLQGLAGRALAFAGPALDLTTGISAFFRPDDPTITAVWALLGSSAARAFSKRVEFEIEFANIPGVNPDEYRPAIVQLVPTRDNYRLVGAAKTKLSHVDGMPTGPIVEEAVPARLTQLERGRYRVSLAGDVAPGEYALVLRPIERRERRRNAPVTLGDLLDGGAADILYMTWDFSVRS